MEITNDNFPMTNQIQNQNDKKYDLAERTTSFANEVVLFTKELTESSVTRPIISQLVRSATSIGANYMEADCAESKRDFMHKIGICKKAKETTYWLKIIPTAIPNVKDTCNNLGRESHELTLIFSAISKRK